MHWSIQNWLSLRHIEMLKCMEQQTGMSGWRSRKRWDILQFQLTQFLKESPHICSLKISKIFFLLSKSWIPSCFQMIVVLGPPLWRVQVKVNGEPWSTNGSAVIVILKGWSETWKDQLDEFVARLFRPRYQDQYAWKIPRFSLQDLQAKDLWRTGGCSWNSRLSWQRRKSMSCMPCASWRKMSDILV